MKAIGITDFLNKTFDVYQIEQNWLDSFGLIEKNFKMSVTGESGGGKTELVIKMVKMLAEKFSAKSEYFSFEQGISATLQKAIERNNMQDVKGKVMFLSGGTFDELFARLKRKASGKIVVIDSQDYSELSTKQYKMLIKAFPKKSFVVISWSKGDKPKNQAAKDIEYMSCIKVFVKDGKAYPRSRFGGNKTFTIFEKKINAPVQKSLFDHGN